MDLRVSGQGPRVSLGMPVYNAERYLEEALGSLLGQSFVDFELVITDNASTDRTGGHPPCVCDKGRARGYGNHSHRLYEAFACGRIPCSSIPPACCRSISRSIGSDSVCGWTPGRPPLRGRPGGRFHASISGEEFAEVRVACRRLWEEC
jgi:hypothetical protein